MVAFVLEITEPDCHLLENKYFFLNYISKKTPKYPKKPSNKNKPGSAIIYCQKLIFLAIILNLA